MKDQAGFVYTIHFDAPFGHAKHYTGFTTNLDARMIAHANGHGSRLMEVVTDAGITWQVAEVREGTRKLERQLKARGATRRCPICKAERMALKNGKAS